MSIKSTDHQSSTIIPFDAHKALVTKWKVKPTGTWLTSSKTYHVVVLKATLSDGITTATRAYITNKITKKENLSASSFHEGDDSETYVLKNEKEEILCSYSKKDSVDLSFEIPDEAFEKVESISPEIITQLGGFLKTSLEEKAKAEIKAKDKEAPKADTEDTAKEAPKADAEDKAKPETSEKESSKPSEPAKDSAKFALSNVCGRITPFVFGGISASLGIVAYSILNNYFNVNEL